MTKRDGSIEHIDLNKIHWVLDWTAEGLNNVSISQVELRSHIQFYDGIKASDTHEIIIETAADLISYEASDCQYLAARLAIFHLCKKAYGEFEPSELFDHVVKTVEMSKHDNHLLGDYIEKEFRQMSSFVVHDRNITFSYTAVKRLEGKHLARSRVTGEIYESAQLLYALVAACLSSNYPYETRLQYVKRLYDIISTFKISLPAPIMSDMRTPTRQFSSCVLVECGGNLDSINTTFSATVKYASQRAGIGINAGRIHVLGSPIRDSEAFHTGRIPFYKHFQTVVKSCSQGGVRGGAATLLYPMWYLEVEGLPALKNNRGVEGNRVRHMDYGVQINRLIYTRLLKGSDITLFSPPGAPGLYSAFFTGQDEFERLYVQYENDDNVRKQRIEAVELLSLMMQERASTDRIYIQNVDHCNTHSPFNPVAAPVCQSNPCLEIALLTKPLTDVNDENGKIAPYALSAFDLGVIESLDELEGLAVLAVRVLDALLDHQDYPIPAAKRGTVGRRMLGTGAINYVYWLAKNGKRYSDSSANNLTHKTFKAIQYYLLKVSNELAKEQDACPWFSETTYTRGILSIDTYKEGPGAITNEPPHMDWEQLRESIETYGLRNSMLSVLMPSETSSQISNTTSGVEPPRGYVSIKTSRDGTLRQIVPDYEYLYDAYELLQGMLNNDGYLRLVGITQKFIDQSASASTNYDPSRFPSGKVPMQQSLEDLLTACRLGIKTLYYQNTRDGAEDSQDDLVSSIQDDGYESGACEIQSFAGQCNTYPAYKLIRGVVNRINEAHPAVHSRQDSHQ